MYDIKPFKCFIGVEISSTALVSSLEIATQEQKAGNRQDVYFLNAGTVRVQTQAKTHRKHILCTYTWRESLFRQPLQHHTWVLVQEASLWITYP